MQRARDGLHNLASDILAGDPNPAVLAWPLVCGTAVACKTQALDCKGGVLRVSVPDASWRSHLADFASQYVAALNELSVQKVESITFVLPDEKREAKSA